MTRAARHAPRDAGDGHRAAAATLPDVLAGGLAVAIGGANVIMQLAQLPVGHGVAESRVESGRLDRHPLKRLRTTFTYIAVTAAGTDDERLALRREVNRAHRHVRSTAADAVQYDALDPAQQLWVAACMYRGVELTYTLLHGTPDETTAEALYRECSRFGTTLQVPVSMWPPDRAAFEEYWRGGLETVRMDDVTRAYLRDFAALGFLPLPLRHTLGPLQQFLTTGFLAEPFRTELGLPWDSRRQFGFEVLTRAGALAIRHLPSPLRAFPFNYFLWDFRRRLAIGQPVI